MLIDILAGLLSGAAHLNGVGRFYSTDEKSMNVGFCLTVLDPYRIFGEEYDAAIKEYVAALRQSNAVLGEKIVLPGDDRISYKNSLGNG